MSFAQQGESCGAWCVTHYLSIKEHPEWQTDCKTFVSQALSIYKAVQFDDNTTAPDWVTAKYSDPWKMIDKLGGTAKLSVEPAAGMAAKVDPDLEKMLQTLKSLSSRNKRTLSGENINTVKGGYAIAVMKNASGGLHYLLLHKNTDFRLYDPNSETLNWTTHKSFGFNDTVTTRPIQGGSPSTYSFTFLGVYILI